MGLARNCCARGAYVITCARWYSLVLRARVYFFWNRFKRNPRGPGRRFWAGQKPPHRCSVIATPMTQIAATRITSPLQARRGHSPGHPVRRSIQRLFRGRGACILRWPNNRRRSWSAPASASSALIVSSPSHSPPLPPFGREGSPFKPRPEALESHLTIRLNRATSPGILAKYA